MYNDETVKYLLQIYRIQNILFQYNGVAYKKLSNSHVKRRGTFNGYVGIY